MHTLAVSALILSLLPFPASSQQSLPPQKHPQRKSFLQSRGRLDGQFTNRGQLPPQRLQRQARISAFAGNTSPIFVQTPAYSSGGFRAGSLVLDDFNGDGKLDLAVGNECTDLPPPCTSGSVGVLLGNGDGTYQTAIVSNLAQLYPSSLAAGDFNRDGKPDLVVGGAGGGVTVLLGKGDGTFVAGATYPLSEVDAIAVGDFNGDGKPDFVAASSSQYSVNVFLGIGDGTFQTGQSYSLGDYPTAITVADFNRDGKVDLAVSTNGASVYVFLGNGDGTLQAANIYGSGGCESSSIASGDFNGDGVPDLVFNTLGLDCSQEYYPGGPTGVLLGNGDGSFQPVETYNLSGINVAVGDINGDGKPDIALGTASCIGGINCGAAFFGTNVVSFLLGNGDGTFRISPVSYTTAGFTDGSASTTGVVVADLNGDGTVDVVVANISLTEGLIPSPGSLGVLLGKGDGTLQGVPSYYALAPYGFATLSGQPEGPVALADFNGDGKLDALTIPDGYVPSVGIVLGNGDGTFGASTSYTIAGTYLRSAAAVAAGDFNGDGKLDVVALTEQCGSFSCTDELLSVLLGNGDGTLQAAKTQSISATYLFATLSAVTDLRGNGKQDLVVAVGCNNPNTNCSQSPIAIFLGNGDGTFQPPQTYKVEGPAQLAVAGDFNGDGKTDLAVITCVLGIDSCSGNDQVGVLFGNGDGTFQPVKTYGDTGYSASKILAADFNEDGNLDLLLGNGAAVLLGNGDGTFQKMQSDSHGGDAPAEPSVGDINGDGKLDIVTQELGVMLGNGDGTFQPASIYAPSGSSILIGDLNGDGKQDVVVDQAVLLNIGSGGLGLHVPAGSSSSATVSAGSMAKYTLSIGGGGVSGTASLSCSGAPSGATCSIPASENVSATTATNFTVSVSTTARSSAFLHRSSRGLQWMWATMLVGFVLLPGAYWKRRSSLRRWGWLPVLIFVITLNACGGGGSGNGGGSGGTTGTYTLTVTAKMSGMSQSEMLTLKVQ